MPADKLLSRLRAAVLREDLKNKRVLAAVSGGADSVALLRLLCLARNEGFLTLCAAHYEHGIRGEESLEDMRFVQVLCAKLGVDLVSGRGSVPEEAARTGEGLESCARRLRHSFLEEARKKQGCELMALAHHRRDRAETVLMHILRGSGLTGAAAMPRQNGTTVRPLIDFSPEELKEYLNAIGQDWREDATNLIPDNPRNALRLKVMPLLKELYPGCEEALCRFAELAGEDDRSLEARVDFHGKKLLGFFAGIGVIDIYWDKALVRRAVKRVYPGADFDAVQRALDAENRRAFVDLGDGYRAWGNHESVFILPPFAKPKPQALRVPGISELKGLWQIRAEEWEAVPIKENRNKQVLNAEALRGACLRLREDGDFIAPLGMGGKTKSLGDYMTDKRFSLPLRDRLPLVAVGKEILWAPYLGISERSKILPGERAVKLTLKSIDSEG